MPVNDTLTAADIVTAAGDLRRWFDEGIKQHGPYAPLTVGDGERIAMLIEDLALLLAHQRPENHVREGIHKMLLPES